MDRYVYNKNTTEFELWQECNEPKPTVVISSPNQNGIVQYCALNMNEAYYDHHLVTAMIRLFKRLGLKVDFEKTE